MKQTEEKMGWQLHWVDWKFKHRHWHETEKYGRSLSYAQLRSNPTDDDVDDNDDSLLFSIFRLDFRYKIFRYKQILVLRLMFLKCFIYFEYFIKCSSQPKGKIDCLFWPTQPKGKKNNNGRTSVYAHYFRFEKSVFNYLAAIIELSALHSIYYRQVSPLYRSH